MATPSPLQHLFGAMGDFLAGVGEQINDSDARKAIIADLGGDPEASGRAPKSPAPQLGSVRKYRESANPDVDAFISAIQDIRAAVTALRSFAEAADLGDSAALDEWVRAILDLLATNHMRLAAPRLYFAMQILNFGEEATSIYGDGKHNYGRFWLALRGVLEFVFGPLDSWNAARVSDRTLLLLAGLLAFVIPGAKDREGQDVLYGFDRVPGTHPPTEIDHALARMLTLQFTNNADSGADAVTDSLLASLAFVPRSEENVDLFVSLGGRFHLEVDLAERLRLVLTKSDLSAVSFLLGEKFIPKSDGEGFDVGITLYAQPDPKTGIAYDLSVARGVGVTFGAIRIEARVSEKVALTKATFRNTTLSLSPGSADGFLARILPADGFRSSFDFAVGVDSDRGRFLEGGAASGTRNTAPSPQAPADAESSPEPPPLPPLPHPDAASSGLSVRIPLGRSLGPVTIHDLQVRLAKEGTEDDPVFLAETSTSLSVAIGPVLARVDRIGIRLGIRVPENASDANLGLFDLDFGFKPPEGVALAIDAEGLVSGGGFLFRDPVQQLYAGFFEVTVMDRLTLKAYGFIATKLPDGSKGYSLVVFLTAEDFQPIQLGMGFTLLGIGGLLAVNRTFDENAMREGLKNGTLGNILFPRDILRKAPEILRSLTTIFPARMGSYLFGPLAKIGWATPTLVEMELALIFEFGARRRLIILGRISALLPSRERDLIRLNMDAMGVIDFDQGTASIDAVLFDSRIAGKFVLTGSMAARMRWKSGAGAGFAIAVGGFNPRFAPPEGMPKLARIAVNLSSGDNPRFLCEAYFAITSNTLQFGARAHVYASVSRFSVEGNVGFDVLIQLSPFHFIADFHASIQLKCGSRNLFKVTVDGELEGPRPLRVAAKATFEIFWCDFSVRFDKTLIQGEKPPLPPAIDVLAELKRALSDPRNWTAQLPSGEREIVSLRKRSGGDAMTLHPLGNLLVRQSVVPLNTQRDLDQFGGAPVAGDRRFRIDSATFGTKRPVRDLFAPAQFFSMPDDEKLGSPSFEEMESGLLFGSEEVVVPAGARVDAPLVYECFVADENGRVVPEPAPYTLPLELLRAFASFGALANAPGRNTGVARFRNDRVPKAVQLHAEAWTIVSMVDGKTQPAVAIASATWSEARAAVKKLNRSAGAVRWQTVAAFEVPA